MALGAVERLEFLLTLNADGATKGFKSLGDTAEKELKKAEGGLDKTAGQMTKFGAGAVAAAGIVGAGLFQAAGSFRDTAIAAGDLSAATGLNVEQASRWNEVASDAGVSTDTLETALNRMNKTAETSPAKFSAIGAEIVRTKDGAVDVNATLLNTIDALNGIQDPALKAQAAADILGKGWTGMSTLIQQGSDNLKTSLDQVSEGQVIDAGELQKAKDYRASLDDLSDAVTNLVNGIGKGAAPVIGALATGLSKVVDLAGKADAATNGLVGQVAALGTVGLGTVGAISAIAGQVIKMRSHFLDAEGGLNKFGKAAVGVGVALGAATLALTLYDLQQQKNANNAKTLTNVFEAMDRATDTEALDGWRTSLERADVAGMSAAETNRIFARTNLDGAQRVLELAAANGENDGKTRSLTEAINAEIKARAEANKHEAEAAQAIEDAAAATDMYQERVKGATADTKKFDLATATVERTMGVFKQTEQDAADKTQALNDKYSALIGKLDNTEAWDNAKKKVDEYIWKSRDGVTSTEEQEQAFRDAIRALADYVIGLDGMPEEKKTKILAELDAGNLSQAQADLEAWVASQKLTVKIGTVIVGSTGPIIPKQGGYASGTESATPGWHPVGERGPELVHFGGGEQVIPNNKLGGIGGGDTYIYNVNAGLDERRVTALLRRNARRGGRNPWG